MLGDILMYIFTYLNPNPILSQTLTFVNAPAYPHQLLDGLKLLNYIINDYYIKVDINGNLKLLPDLVLLKEVGFYLIYIDHRFYYINEYGYILSYIDINNHLILPFVVDIHQNICFIENLENIQSAFNPENANLEDIINQKSIYNLENISIDRVRVELIEILLKKQRLENILKGFEAMKNVRIQKDLQSERIVYYS